jgi:hypothetical protein
MAEKAKAWPVLVTASGADIMPRERKLQVLADWSSMAA